MQVDAVLVCPNPKRVLGPSEAHFYDPNVYWSAPPLQNASYEDPSALNSSAFEARNSWDHAFHFKEEARNADDTIKSVGLRPPQIGAIHAAIGHWRSQDEAGTIVMPTGTGKTEVMLSLLVAEQIPRLLVLVPTNALRAQIAEKFQSLGLLRTLGLLDVAAANPVVATLTAGPGSGNDINRVFDAANVIVSTAALIASLPSDSQELVADRCSHLFIDEAHHVPARTWYSFKQRFQGKRILQFTATPFRRDKRLVEGRQVFSYPLRKAQSEGYFRPVKFVPIDVFPESAGHSAIAAEAIKQLNADLGCGFDHLVMARVNSIKRAEKLLEIYHEIDGVQAVVVHSKLSDRQLEKQLSKLRSRAARVAICVDMFGESFDMPELKIAAIHDVHKSVATTLQFVGRFTRSGHHVGNATLVANLADAKVEGALRDLYDEDADWNAILPIISERLTRRQLQRTAFAGGFTNVPAEIPLLSIEPKMSAVVFRTQCRMWQPQRAADSVPNDVPVAGPIVNAERTVALYVTRETAFVDWARVTSPRDTSWHLYLAYWDSSRQLLFINSSNDVSHELLARDVSAGTARKIDGEQVFRLLKGIRRLTLMNMGVKSTMNRATRFTMYVGSDILASLTEANQQNRIKTNLFGKGYEDGNRATAGCSLKGKLWSYRIAEDITEWIEWCHQVGAKLLDETTSTDDLFKDVVWPTEVTARPQLFPISVDWPDAFLLERSLQLDIEIDGAIEPFFDVSLELDSPSENGPLRFSVVLGQKRATYEVSFPAGDIAFTSVDTHRAFLHPSRQGRRPIEEIFVRDPPLIRFADGSWLEGNRHFPPSRSIEQPFSSERITAWDWSGTNIRQESQRAEKRSASVQFRTIEYLKKLATGVAYDLIIDDDGGNEVADVVCLQEAPNHELIVHLFHCKFSLDEKPGARVEDLYAVCGQAQKSIVWRENIARMLEMLVVRDSQRARRSGVSGIERGNSTLLRKLWRKSHLLAPNFSVWIVQPGLSKAKVSERQLHLLAVTELYLKETFNVPLSVIGSA
ncbi:MAG: DEAD/DEAH box helicase family protein [Gammaproteobacteria bacterium]